MMRAGGSAAVGCRPDAADAELDVLAPLKCVTVIAWRRMMKVPWTEHKTDEELLHMVQTEREIMDTVRSRQERWLGHILRHDSVLSITLEGQIQRKKVHGRPRTMLLDWLLKTKEGNICYED